MVTDLQGAMSVRRIVSILPRLFLVAWGLVAWASGPRPDADTIVRRSVEAFSRDWQKASEYDYFERDLVNNGTRTYRVMMILGSPYSRLTAVNGVAIPPREEQEEERKFRNTIAKRCGESKRQREERIRTYERDRAHDHQLIAELTNAFVFQMAAGETVDGHATWLLQSSPRPGYRPPNEEARVLTGMEGKLWIDQATFEWVKVEARVVRPVSMEGFLATVEPGTEFKLVRAPGPGGTWVNTHFLVTARATILSLFPHHTHENETYFDYRNSGSAGTPACPVKP